MAIQKRVIGSGLCAVGLWLFAFAGAISVPAEGFGAVLFTSDFTGTQGDPVASLAEWSNAYAPTGTSRTLDNNMLKLYGSGTAWLYQGIRADKSEGVAFNFHPFTAGGLRFEHTVNAVDSTDAAYALMQRAWVGPQPNATASAYNVIGERAVLYLQWNQSTNVLTVYLVFINSTTTTTDTGTNAHSMTVSVDLDAGDHVRAALEVRDGGGADVRIACKKYTAASGTWSDWTTSDWFNPTDAAYGTDAFGADWKARWANNTYYYIEHSCRNSGSTALPSTAWIDDVTVTGEVPPVATPAFSPDGGCLTEDCQVAISCATAGAAIHYTLDGSEPTQEDPSYIAPVTVSPGQTLSARAWLADHPPSAVKTAHYPAAAVIFQSDFTGTQDDPVASLAEWSNAYAPTGTGQTLDSNMLKFYGSGTAWLYQGIRADKSEGVAFNFHPFTAGGLRFEHTVNAVDSTDAAYALMQRAWVGSQPNATASAYNVIGERAVLYLQWNQSTNVLTVYLVFINSTTTTTDTGTNAHSMTVSVDLDAGDHVRAALEVRDGGGADVRIACKKYTAASGTWSDWTTSDWFDPTDAAYGTDAFGADWKARWANNTYYYIEHSCRNSGSTALPSTAWIDDVRVIGEVVPDTEMPTFSPDGGFIEAGERVTIECATPGARIYYTLDGSVPTEDSFEYAGPVVVNPGQTLSARAFATGYAPGPIKTATYRAFTRPVRIYRLDGSVTVDGDLSEWTAGEFVPMNVNYSGTPGLQSAAYAARWDGTTHQIYVAVKVNDPTRVFADMYDSWNTQDGIEVYLHTTGGEPYDYEDAQNTAQQYVLGLKTPASRTSDPRADVWATFAGMRIVPRDEIGFQAAGVEELDEFGNPTGWLFYEVAMTAYEWLPSVGEPLPDEDPVNDPSTPVISPLSVGDRIGVDVVVCDKYATGFGMKSENDLRNKYNDWRQIGVHKLALYPGDFDGDDQLGSGDIDLLAAQIRAGTNDPDFDLTGDGLVNAADLDILVRVFCRSQYGDANVDGRVTFEDFAALQNHYGQSGGWADGDFNADGQVTFADFALLQNHYGQDLTGGTAPAAGDIGTAGGVPCGGLGVVLSVLAGLGRLWLKEQD